MADLDRAAALDNFPVSRETQERLNSFIALLERWQDRTNLVASSTLAQVWTRHVADSLQLLALTPKERTWLDIGSGGGFPGIVLACALADQNGAQVYLVERNNKKAAFLREALRISGGAGQIHQGDIYHCRNALPARMDVVTARAVAPLSELLEMTGPWLAKGAKGLFPKGQDVADEVESATASWDFSLQSHASRTGPGRILEISNFRGQRPNRTPHP